MKQSNYGMNEFNKTKQQNVGDIMTKCKNCKTKTDDPVIAGIYKFCKFDCAFEYAKSMQAKQQERQQAKAKQSQAKSDKDDRKTTRERKKELMTRAQWYDKLQTLVNQYVRLVRDIDKPCCTCGTTNPNIKYDAGHFFTRKARPDIRFELTNIHKQCSMNCNQFGSGMRNEYEKFIIKEYSQEHLDFLTLQQDNLKTQFPTWQDIETEIIRYRKLLRENGITPNS